MSKSSDLAEEWDRKVHSMSPEKKKKITQMIVNNHTKPEEITEYELVQRPWYLSFLFTMGLILAYIFVAIFWVFMKITEAGYSVAWEAKEKLRSIW